MGLCRVTRKKWKVSAGAFYLEVPFVNGIIYLEDQGGIKNEMDCCRWWKILLIDHHKWRMCLQHLLFFCCLVSGFTGIDEVYLFLICKLAKNVLRCFRERKLIVITWLLHWKTLQPELNMVLSVSRTKNMGTKGKGWIGLNVWRVSLVFVGVYTCIRCWLSSMPEMGIQN